MNVKQVIVMRKDLNMRKGKMVSQGSHASLGAVLSMMTNYDPWKDMEMYKFLDDMKPKKYTEKHLKLEEGSPINEWINGIFTKICVGVNSEEELENIYYKAKEAGLPVSMIEDKGLTEFNGILTKTCIGIGPAESEEIDKITGHLKLL